MAFNEEYMDEAFLNALSDVPMTTAKIAELVGCSHEAAKGRLATLTKQKLVIKSKEPSSGRLGFKYVWKRSDNTIPEEIKPSMKQSEKRKIELLDLISDEKPTKLTYLMQETDLSYPTLKKYLLALSKDGKIVQTKFRDSAWLKVKEDAN